MERTTRNDEDDDNLLESWLMFVQVFKVLKAGRSKHIIEQMLLMLVVEIIKKLHLCVPSPSSFNKYSLSLALLLLPCKLYCSLNMYNIERTLFELFQLH